MSGILIPGVTNISVSSMERAFRQNKTMSQEIKKGPRCKIENMRTILKNWFNPADIPDTILTKKNKSRYRGLVYAYLRDKNTTKCPEPFKALIEEYMPYITDEKLIKQHKVKTPLKQNNKVSKSNEHDVLQKNVQVFKQFSQYLKQLGAKEFKVKFEESELCINIF